MSRPQFQQAGTRSTVPSWKAERTARKACSTRAAMLIPLLLCLTGLTLLTACQGVSSGGNSSNQQQSSALVVSPGTLALGSVAVGSSGSASGSLSASGASVTVTAASTSNSAFSVSGLTLPVTITAGNSIPFTVTFSPQAAGAASGKLTFTSDAQTSASAEALTGTGTAAGSSYSVALSWNASTSSNISGYNVYRAMYASSACGSFSKINSTLNTSTLYTDAVVTDGTSYCYATTAVNSSNEESGYSNVVSNVKIP